MITSAVRLDIQNGNITIDLDIRPDYDVQVDLYDYILKSLEQPQSKVTLSRVTDAGGEVIPSGHGKVRIVIDGKGVVDQEREKKKDKTAKDETVQEKQPITKVALNKNKPEISTTEVVRSEPRDTNKVGGAAARPIDLSKAPSPAGPTDLSKSTGPAHSTSPANPLRPAAPGKSTTEIVRSQPNQPANKPNEPGIIKTVL